MGGCRQRVHGGEAMNVIPASVKINGTFRSLTNPGIALVKQRIQEMAIGIATTNRCQATVTFPIQEYPPTINDESCWAVSRKAAEAVVGPKSVLAAEPILGGEDFAFYQQHIPGCFSVLGISAAAPHPDFVPLPSSLCPIPSSVQGRRERTAHRSRLAHPNHPRLARQTRAAISPG
jgi:metal-dependent amidase/aminoacylase/carboxypeptidase family protein